MAGPGSRKRRVTQEEVSRRAGVSRSVVSYVLNGGPRPVSDEARRRVLAAIRDLDYRPNEHARSLIADRWGTPASRQIGVVLARGAMFQRPFYGEILRALHEAVHGRHGHVRFIRVLDAFRDPVLLNQLVHRDEVSGIALVGPVAAWGSRGDGEDTVERIVARLDNVVCVDGSYRGLASVGFDRRGAARDATRHLLGLGHRRVAYVGPRDERVDGYREALAAGDGHAVAVEDADDARSGWLATGRVVSRLRAGAPAPAREGFALVTGSDDVAFGALRRLREAGIGVPGGAALVSIDDVELAAYASPALTTVDVPKAALGAEAVRLLLERSPAGAAEERTLLLPTRLVVRESCGARPVVRRVDSR